MDSSGHKLDLGKKSLLVGKHRLAPLTFSDPIIFSDLFNWITNKKIQKFNPDNSRVIARPFKINDETRAKNIIKRVLGIDEDEVVQLYKTVIKDFSFRHKDIEGIFMRHFKAVEQYIESKESLSTKRKLLLGSYFTSEYSIESVALFNPSIAVYPKQNDLKEGQTRVIISFRATGEGHISSIVFRSAVIDKHNNIFLEPFSRYVSTPQIILNPVYDKYVFELKLKEMNILNEFAETILNRLGNQFTYDQLQECINQVNRENIPTQADKEKTISEINWLAKSNYEVIFPPEQLISERVIFPVAERESNGIEDARFVRFINDDGTAVYYATYTAYNGFDILPQLIETRDFHHFKISTLNGKMARNKGMALFPRKINGKYAMISRIDGENLYLMYSDNVHFWSEAIQIQSPQRPWEFVQIGNCGSPIETKAGWILLTHGVGPMRKYCIGIELLDLKDPSKIIARLDAPLLSPREKEREGYVPNVVYSCGSIILNEDLIIPYATSDSTSAIAIIGVDELLQKLTSV